MSLHMNLKNRIIKLNYKFVVTYAYKNKIYEYIISVNNNNSYLGKKSQPCCINDPIANHIQFIKVNCVSIFPVCESQGEGVGHSYGVNLKCY